MNVWKVGSRWGNQGESVLDKFAFYGVVFFNVKDCERIGNYQSAQPGDLIIVSDGCTAVALAKLESAFQPYSKSGIRLLGEKDREFADDDLAFARAALRWFDKDDSRDASQWRWDGRKRFCQASYALANAVKKWEQMEKEENNFTIKPSTKTLCGGKGASLFSPDIRYRIPVYQRPYSWTEDQLGTLLQDIVDASKLNEPYFMSTMQLDKPLMLSADGKKVSHNIIDGQQRITTLLLVLRVLEWMGCGKCPVDLQTVLCTFVNRGNAQDHWEKFCGIKSLEELNEQSATVNPYITNAKIIHSWLKNLNVELEKLEMLNKFIKEKLIFVVIETHAGLSKTLDIFNTINTSGLDLSTEDLFKLRFYEYLDPHGTDNGLFDRIADCYKKVSDYNDRQNRQEISIGDVIRIYQRIVIAQYALPVGDFYKAPGTFFNDFFEKSIREASKGNDSANRLTLEDFERVTDTILKFAEHCHKDSRLSFWRDFCWWTRYGNELRDLPLLAVYFGCCSLDEAWKVAESGFKFALPTSLYFAKRVYDMQARIVTTYRDIVKERDVLQVLAGRKSDGRLREYLCRALEYEIAWNAGWKNLLCRLVEYIKTRSCETEKIDYPALRERLFASLDIEHIQPFTDEHHADSVREEWKGLLNQIGNLIVLEPSINRQINNKKDKKSDGYAESKMRSALELKDKVCSWSKVDAEVRQKECMKLVLEFFDANES